MAKKSTRRNPSSASCGNNFAYQAMQLLGFSTAGLAKELNVSRSTIERWLRAGRHTKHRGFQHSLWPKVEILVTQHIAALLTLRSELRYRVDQQHPERRNAILEYISQSRNNAVNAQRISRHRAALALRYAGKQTAMSSANSVT